jgi:hypothetical protein
VALAGISLALWFFTANDGATTSGPPLQAPGEAYGGQAPLPSDLRRGNVVLEVHDSDAFASANALSQDLGDARDAGLRAAGQAVVLTGVAGAGAWSVSEPEIRCTGPCPAVVAYAQGRRLAVRSPRDPALRAFVEYWLGRSAG